MIELNYFYVYKYNCIKSYFIKPIINESDSKMMINLEGVLGC